MEKFIVKFEGSTTKYNQIAKHIKFLIEKKLIEDGEKLPSIRSLATYLCVNNSTIISAYKKLQEEGYVIIKDGSGTFAKTKRYSINFKKKYVEITRQLSQNKECCDFTGENIDIDFFSINTFKKVLNEVIDFYGVESLTYQDRIGFEDLRNSIKDYFWDGSIKSE
ncbi:MAG: GntR family transcriptional regulator, partial [Clostridiaceae bacterium]